jgi:hypothetical protein
MEGGNKMLKAKKKSLLIAFAFILALVSLTALRSAGKKWPSEIPVTATFRVDFPGDRIGSDGLGAYIDQVDDVHAVIDARGNFDMITAWHGGQKVMERMLYLDFQDPASTLFNPPFLNDCVLAFMSTGVGDLPLMEINSSVSSNLGVNFGAAGGRGWFNWFIRFNPDVYSGTNSVQITRLSEDTWEIEAVYPAIAQLLSYPTKGKFVKTNEGLFHMPFKVTVKKK